MWPDSDRSDRPAVDGLAGPELRQESLADLEEVADDEHVGEVRDRRVRVAVDRDDRLGRLHADLVLDRPGDAEGEVEPRLHDLAGLADLLGVRDPARVNGRTGRADRA